MNFDEWYDQDETIVQNDIEVYDLEAVWNAALDEAVKVANSNLETESVGDASYDNGFDQACENIAKAIKELK